MFFFKFFRQPYLVYKASKVLDSFATIGGRAHLIRCLECTKKMGLPEASFLCDDCCLGGFDDVHGARTDYFNVFRVADDVAIFDPLGLDALLAGTMCFMY